MGAISSCVERLGKRSPDGPVISGGGSAGSRQEQTRYSTQPSQGVLGGTTDQRGRRRPTVTAKAAAAEMEKFKATRESLDFELQPSVTDEAEDAGGRLRQRRLEALVSNLGNTAKVKAGLFEKPVTFRVDSNGQVFQWFVSGSSRPTGSVVISEIVRCQPHRRDPSIAEIQTPTETHAFVFDNADSRAIFEAAFSDIQRFVQ